MKYRAIYHDVPMLRFAGDAELLEHLRNDTLSKTYWQWNYLGITRMIPLDIMDNALDLYEAFKKQRHRREPIPKHVGMFSWDQTIELPDESQESLDSGTGDVASSGSEPDH